MVLKCSPSSCFNLESASGNRNNCRLAMRDFLQGRELYTEKHLRHIPPQMFSFPKARFQLLNCPMLPNTHSHILSLAVSPTSSVYLSSFTALLRDHLHALAGSFICWFLVEARGGHQMKNINHTGVRVRWG